MPGMSGTSLCRVLKSRYETAHVPVVLFSDLPPDQLEPLASSGEADGFLSKEGGFQVLADELAALCASMLW